MAQTPKSTDLVVSGQRLPVAGRPLPTIVEQAGAGARFAWEELFEAELANEHTRKAYERAVRRFAGWCEQRGLELAKISPGDVGRYFKGLKTSIPTKKLALAAIRRFFDLCVTRHAMLLNPAASVRGERYQVVEGKTPEISVEQARVLLASIAEAHVVGLRDRAVIATMIYTAARVGAVAKLNVGHFQHDGTQSTLRFEEKGGKSREIPVRHDLELLLKAYLQAAGLQGDPRDAPLFRSTVRKSRSLTGRRMTAVYMCQMVKRRLKDAGLPERISPHSFRVATITDLLNNGADLKDVQYFAGHADPRTTRLYDRTNKKVTRNLVERISI